MANKYFELWCNCRTEHLEFNWFEDDQLLYISHFINSFYAEQTGIFNII